MAYETKSIYKMLYLFAERAKTKEEILDFIREAANSEGVVIAPKSNSADENKSENAD